MKKVKKDISEILKSIQKQRCAENYDRYFWDRMSDDEKQWARDFELLEYWVERGHARKALDIARKLNPNITSDFIDQIHEDVETLKRCNPERVEAEAASRSYKAKGQRAVKADEYYSPGDWVEQKFGINPQTGDEFEMAVSTNPEDALIAALDAAAVHGVSLETFVSNPLYFTERKAGRPKKVQE